MHEFYELLAIIAVLLVLVGIDGVAINTGNVYRWRHAFAFHQVVGLPGFLPVSLPNFF